MGLEGLCAGEGDATGSPGEREGAEGVSGAGRGAEEGEEGWGIGVGLPAAGLEAADGKALTGLGAVGGPRGFGDTGGGRRCLGSVRTKNIALLWCCCVLWCVHLYWFYLQCVCEGAAVFRILPGLCAVSAVSGPGMGTLRVGVGGSA